LNERSSQDMIARFIVVCSAAVFFYVHNASAQTQHTTECDKLAASPEDPHRNAPGIELSKVNVKAAVPACEAAVEQLPNEARLHFQLGRAYSRAKKYQSAAEHYKKAAEAGYAVAQFNLGIMYYRGRGVRRDYVLAYMWFNVSAAQTSSAVARQNVARHMSPAQLTQAQKMSLQCRAQTFKDCEVSNEATPMVKP
jgi:TPR repeat protein